MKTLSLTVRQIAEAIGAEVEGDGERTITGFASVDQASEGDLTFVTAPGWARLLADSHASAAIVGPDVTVPEGLTALRTAHPAEAVAKALALAADPDDAPPAGVHPTAVVDPSATLGANAAVGPHAVVGAGAAIGDNVVLSANVCVGADVAIGAGTILMAGVVVRQGCRIGRRCRIQPNAVIGADGFGYYFREGVHHRVPHAGIVEIGDDVEIGACACVDRAKFDATRVGDGTKIDNLVQIAHNVQIGRGALMASLAGVAGSAVLGDYVVLGGHVGIKDNVTIGDGVRVAAYSACLQSVPAGKTVGGVAGAPIQAHRRVLVLYEKIPEMWDKTRKLQKRLDALENAAKDDRSAD